MAVPPTSAPDVVLCLQLQVNQLTEELNNRARDSEANISLIRNLQQELNFANVSNQDLQTKLDDCERKLYFANVSNQDLLQQLEEHRHMERERMQRERMEHTRMERMERERMEHTHMERMERERMEHTRMERIERTHREEQARVEEQARMEKQVKEDSIMVVKLTITQLHDTRNKEERDFLLEIARTKISEIMQFYPDDRDVSNLCKALDDFVQKNYGAVMPKSSSASSSAPRACNRGVDSCYPCSAFRCPNKLSLGMKRGLCWECEASRE
jgi:hypothetical protein